MVQRKGHTRVPENSEDLAHVPLQAVLLADSFAQKFRPITLERPKVLLPLVNVPMIDYTLAWLESAGVEELFVFCCAHAKQVISHLESSHWFSQPNFSITTIESRNSISAGDALRVIYERNVIHGDFILVSGDTVSNMSLKQALQEHKERRRKDSNAVMTMVIKQSKLSRVTHQSRHGTDELFMAIDPQSKQLLYYEDKSDNHKMNISLEKSLLIDNASISFHNDKLDCFVDICSEEVLSLFTDNFDYQHLRRHFVKGLLVDDLMGYKIYTHEIHSSYAARIDNFRSYDAVSKDIIQRWTCPFVPDIHFLGNNPTKLERQAVYKGAGVDQSYSAEVGPFSVIGSGTILRDNSKITSSVIGENCTVGCNVFIEGSYIWNNVIIEDGCRINHAIVCDGVIVKSGAVLEPGVVLSFRVTIGKTFTVPSYSKVSLLQQPSKQDSDDELECSDDNVVNSSAELTDRYKSGLSEIFPCTTTQVGAGGTGFMWPVSEEGSEEEWRQSIAPIPVDKYINDIHCIDDDPDTPHDSSTLPNSGELKVDSNSYCSGDDFKDNHFYFENEVEATFLRAVNESVKVDTIILEVNSLRLSYNMTSIDCASSIFYSVMKLGLDAHKSSSELLKSICELIITWQKLLRHYMPSLDEQIEVILKFEEMCQETTVQFAPLFSQVLHFLYDQDFVQEDAILRWAYEKEEADESDKVFLKQSEKFIQWLKEAEEED